MPRQSQPEPPEPVPGFVWTVALAGASWRVDAGRECRRKVDFYTTCRKPSVLAVNRRRHYRDGRITDWWWPYCEDHAYGRWVAGGQVWQWTLRPDDQARTLARALVVDVLRNVGHLDTGTAELLGRELVDGLAALGYLAGPGWRPTVACSCGCGQRWVALPPGHPPARPGGGR